MHEGKFVKHNANPKGRKTCDCVVRAIATATGKEWLEVFDALYAAARERALMPNEPRIFGRYLEENGFAKGNCHPAAGERRRTVRELAAQIGVPAVVRVANHLVALDGDGNYIDTHDCGDKCAYALWAREA